jgi:hypothetical protein
VIALAAARTTLCAYRAAHQSITIDEAYTFNHYLDGAWSNIFAQPYFTNNHVLYSILAKFSQAIFGNAEWALRLPSVLAGFFLILGVFAVLEISVSRAVRWVALIALALHPLLLDFSVAARGYGLGLTLLIWAIYFAMRGRPILSGLFIGFAISAQLSIAPAALALLAALVLLRQPVRTLFQIAIPAAAVAFAICAPVMRSGVGVAMHIGYPTLRESVYSLFNSGDTDRMGRFIHAGSPWVIGGIAVVLAICLFIGASTCIAFLRHRDMRLLPSLTFLLTCAGFVAAHFILRTEYPVDRTGVPLILLFGISWAIAAEQIATRINIVIGIAFAIQFAAQFDMHSMRLWKFDSDTRHVAELTLDQTRTKSPAGVSVSTVWINLQSLEYYRRTLPIPALRPIKFHDPPPLSGFDFYVLNAADNPLLDPHTMRVLYQGDRSGTILARDNRD